MKALKTIFAMLLILSGSLKSHAQSRHLTAFKTKTSSISTNYNINTCQLDVIENSRHTRLISIFQKPPVSESKLFAEVGSGILFSTIMGAAGLGIGLFFDVATIFGNGTYFHLTELGFLVGSVVGSSFGVLLIGINQTETGNKFATFGGSLIGGLINYAIPEGVYHDPYTDFYSFQNIPKLLLSSITSSVFATVAFNLTREYKQITNLNAYPTFNGITLTYKF